MPRHPILIVLALALVAAGSFLVLRGGADAPAARYADRTSDAPVAPRRLASADPPASSGKDSLPAISLDDDPPGPLRLEGLVLGGDDLPVAGAVVRLSSSPPRETESAEDGSFVFEDLVGKSYSLYARTDGEVGGPVVHQLTDRSDPVVIRVREGAILAVTVVRASSGEPIEGARVALGADAGIAATTGGDGVATLRAVPEGQHVLLASAPGLADARQLVDVPNAPGVTIGRQLQLADGVTLAGRVVDTEGAPIAGARVVARPASSLLDLVDVRRDGVITGDDGAFTLPGAPTGAVQLVAAHRDHAPTTTEAIDVPAGSDPEPVEIVLEPGGAVAGVVVARDGAPVPWATVRVGADPDTGGWGLEGSHRQVVAGEDGRFEITGLRRAALVLSAQSDTAASELLPVDLAARRRIGGLSVPLVVEGRIAGVVVDEHGEPVAEAQVMAVPDFWQGGELRQLAARGPSFATSDGGGRFELRGLPDTRFRLRAAPGALSASNFTERGVAAETGDTDVELVLASPGSIVGELALADGSAPELATVSIGFAAGVPATGGRFRLDHVRPGEHDLAVRGPGFPEKIVPKVEVSAGETTDVGTISLRRGRSVRGVVVDAGGAPVAGAEVVVGKQILSDGSDLTSDDLGGMLDGQLALRRATSGSDGSFRIDGIGAGSLAIAAEHDERGRSPAQKLAAGAGDLQARLTLAPFGSLRGTVTRNGQPAAGINVLVSPTSGASQFAMVEGDERGQFRIARLAAGSYKVSAMTGQLGGASTASELVEVPAEAEAVVELSIAEGDVTVRVTIEGEDGAHIDAAQVFLFEGSVDAATGGALNELFLSGSSGSSRMAFAFGAAPASFDKVVPGPYSLCIVPINGDMNDPGFAARLQRHVETLAVHCQPAEVAAAPAEQSFPAVVPPMEPLPEDEDGA